MVVSYFYLAIDEFPDLSIGKSIASETQLALPGTEGDATAHTTFTYKGEADDPQFDRYLVEHQYVKDTHAIFKGQTLRKLIFVTEFHVFTRREEGYLLAQTNKAVARAAFGRLDKAGIQTHEEQISLSWAQQVGDTTGGWFGNLQMQNVNAAALFGEGVMESEDWERYEELGDLSAVNVRIANPSDQSVRTVMLTRNRGVILFQDHGDGDNLKFAAELQRSLSAIQQAGPPASSP